MRLLEANHTRISVLFDTLFGVICTLYILQCVTGSAKTLHVSIVYASLGKY